MKTFNEAFNHCPITKLSETFHLSNAQLDMLFKRARDAGSVTYLPDLGFWAVTRYDDIKEILGNKEKFSAEIVQQPLEPYAPEVLQLFKERNFDIRPTLSNNERDDHARIRINTLAAFTAARSRKLEPYIRRLMKQKMDAFEADGKADLVAGIFYELPALVLFKLLGIPDQDVEKIKRWSDSRLIISFGRPTLEQQLAAAADMVDYWDYCKALVQKRLAAPQDDLPSDMLRTRNGDDSILTVEDINNVVYGLLFAGHETTTNMASNAVLTLLEHRSVWEEIVADPSLIPAAVEECLRYRSSVVAWRRLVLTDVEIRGVKIPAGDKVMVFLPAGNRDEEKFPDSESFDIHRQWSNRHISFGFGRHACLGAPLARFELQVILEELSKRFPGLRLSEGQSLMPVEAVQFRGPAELWVEW